MKKDTARVLITLKCNRNCEGCCNKDEDIMKQMVAIDSLKFGENIKTVCVTGGEPMLNPLQTQDIIREIKELNPPVKIYLYTALWKSTLHLITEDVDGIQFSLHEHPTKNDLYGLYQFQALAFAWYKYNKSFRVFIDNRCKEGLDVIMPWVYTRFEIKPWLDKCPLPENEELYYYTGGF